MFLTEFQVVAEQVAILFVLIAVGFACQRLKMLTEQGNKCIADVVMYIVTPCVIIRSFQRQFDSSLLREFLIVMAAAAVLHVVMILATYVLFRDPDKARQGVLRFATVFSNCGFVGLPLAQAVLGDTGVFFVSGYIVVFNIIVWTWGLMTMQGGQGKITFRKAVLNPGVVGVALGMVIFLFSIPLPKVISASLEYVSSLNVPLPMMLVGYYLGTALSGAKSGKGSKAALRQSALCIAMRLVVMPLVFLGLLYLCGIRGTMLVSIMVCMAAPVGTMTTLLAAKYDRSTELSVKLVSISTLLSMATMPVIVALAKVIC